MTTPHQNPKCAYCGDTGTHSSPHIIYGPGDKRNLYELSICTCEAGARRLTEYALFNPEHQETDV